MPVTVPASAALARVPVRTIAASAKYTANTRTPRMDSNQQDMSVCLLAGAEDRRQGLTSRLAVRFLFAAESRPQNAQVGLLAWKERTPDRHSLAASPSPVSHRVVISKPPLHSQWRDRAGFTPDFPVMPSWAPEQQRA